MRDGDGVMGGIGERECSGTVTAKAGSGSAAFVCALAMVLVGSPAGAGESGQAANRWETPPRRQNQATFSALSVPAVTVTLKARGGTTLPGEALVVAAGPSGTFTGDVSGARSVEFQLVSDGHLPEAASVWLVGRTSGRIWISRRVAVSSDPRAVVVNSIPLARTEGGWEGPGTDLDAAWLQDCKDVGYLGVRIKQLGLEAQSYAIRGLVLNGETNVTHTLALNSVDANLWDRYRVLTAAAVPSDLAGKDSDKDGMTDLNEVLVGTNPDDERSRFAMKVRSAANGIRIQWPCVEGGVYQLCRCEQVGGEYIIISGNSPLVPTAEDVAAGVMGFDDAGATGQGPYFYKVEKR